MEPSGSWITRDIRKGEIMKKTLYIKRVFYRKRALIIFKKAKLGIYSQSLKRRVKISDIWKTPNYLG